MTEKLEIRRLVQCAVDGDSLEAVTNALLADRLQSLADLKERCATKADNAKSSLELQIARAEEAGDDTKTEELRSAIAWCDMIATAIRSIDEGEAK